jgi:ketosteroid isomerase-like protein
MTDIREDRKTLFSKLQSPETQQQFWARVADDVDWTVEGTHPLAGRYHNKQEFIDATFGRLAGVLVGRVKLEVQHLFVDGETTIAELRSKSTTIEGAVFAQHLLLGLPLRQQHHRPGARLPGFGDGGLHDPAQRAEVSTTRARRQGARGLPPTH